MRTKRKRQMIVGAIAMAGLSVYLGHRRASQSVTAIAASAAAPSGLMPWQATRENAPQIDEHHIPAWKVPTTPPVAWTPPPVVEPPDPLAHPPPLQNPGGVNGDRPPRQ